MSLVLIAALASSTFIGFLLTKIFLPAWKPLWADVTFRICLGAGLGAGVSSCVYFLVRLAGHSRLACVITELLVLAGAGVAAWLTRGSRSLASSQANPKGWAWLLLVAFCGALAMAVFIFADASRSSPYGAWDAWAIWNLRARFLAQPDVSWKAAFSPALNHLVGGNGTHPDYPLLLSAYVARCWSFAASIGDVTPPIAVAAVFSFGTIGLVVSGLASVRGWSASMLGGLILLGTAGFLLDSSWQYADVPLGFYYVAFFALFVLAADRVPDHRRVAVLAGLALGFAACTKNEGLLFGVLAGLAFAGYQVAARNPGWRRSVAMLAAGAAIPLAIGLYFKFFLAPPTGTYASVTVASALHKLLEPQRYARILKACWEEGLALGAGIAHPVVSLAVLAGCLGISPERRRQPVILASLAALIALSAGYFFTYVITPLDLSWHLDTSLGRLYVQLWPSFVFVSLTLFRTAEETAIAVKPAQKATRVTAKKRRKAQVG